MTLQDLKNQLHQHGTMKFIKHYGISATTLYNSIGGVRGTILKRRSSDPIPDNGMTRQERRKIFYELTKVGNEERGLGKIIAKEESMRKAKYIVENYIPPTPEKYTGSFLQFMNRF